MKKILYVFALLVSFSVSARPLEETTKPQEIVAVNRIGNTDVAFQLPRFIFTYTNTRVIVKFNNPTNSKLLNNNYELDFIVNGANQKVIFDHNGIGSFYYTFRNNSPLQILFEDANYTVPPSAISIWYIVGPLLAVLLFFLFRAALTIKNNKTPKLIVQHNLESIEPEIKSYPSTLKVVRVKELEEV